jgi:membrane fusion protein (multidrug efflux system)
MTQANILLAPAPTSLIDRVNDPEIKPDRSNPPFAMPPASEPTGHAGPRLGMSRRRLPAWMLALGFGLSATAAYFYVPSLYFVETDDAAVQADTVTVVPKVAAYVTALRVTDNSAFSANQLLVELDPRDYEVAVASATATVQSAQAAQANVEAELRQQDQVIAADDATVQGDRATLAFAEQELVRFRDLAKTGAGTSERWQQAQSDIGQRQAALQRDIATLGAARASVDVLKTQIRQAEANVAGAQAALAQAQLNLSYTRIYAQSSGTVADRIVQVGNFVQPGQKLFSAVPNEVYVIANFKETQLAQMHTGQPVRVTVDALPDLKLHGHVDSFQRGTGSNFALLPPENATGNFVKIVQRVPVKILLDDADENSHLVAPGMSVEATVTVHTPPRWLSALR